MVVLRWVIIMDYKQIKAIEKANKGRILKVCPDVTEAPGIYVFYREEHKLKFAYVGQAKHLLTRLAQHLTGYQHIDLSIKKHGLYSEDNPCGYRISFVTCHLDELDTKEQEYIVKVANLGYQLRNKTSGSQGKGKVGIAENKPPKGYYDGLKQGYLNAQKFVANLFDKHLQYSKKSEKPNKLQEKALDKFADFLKWSDSE